MARDTGGSSSTPTKLTPAQIAAQMAAAAAQAKANAAKPAMFASGVERQRESGGRSTGTIASGATSTVAVGSTSSTVIGDTGPGTQPGKAWVLVDGKWAKPPMPTDGKTYNWNDADGWVAQVISATGTKVPAKGTVLSTARGSKPGFRVDIIADGEGGITYSEDIADANPIYGESSVVAGSTGTAVGAVPEERNLAENTFTNTFALMFSSKEASEPYVKKLYAMVFGFYKTGSTIDESINLALHEAQNNNAIPEFTKRFNGIFALKDKNLKGAAFKIPTIAEFIRGENDMGDILRSAGFGDLATQEYLGNVIGLGKSVNDVANAVNDSFNAIDNAPQDVKDTLAKEFPMLDRTTLAKSLIMGPDGTAMIQKKINSATSITAIAKQGIEGLSDSQIAVLTNSGMSYGQQSNALGTVKSEGARGQELTNIYGSQVEGFGQNQAFEDTVQNLASAERKKKQLIAREAGNFGGSSGGLKDSYGTPRSSFGKNPAGQV